MILDNLVVLLVCSLFLDKQTAVFTIYITKILLWCLHLCIPPSELHTYTQLANKQFNLLLSSWQT